MISTSVVIIGDHRLGMLVDRLPVDMTRTGELSGEVLTIMEEVGTTVGVT